MDLYALLVAPFTDYAFMARALAGAVILAMSAGPLGVFLMLRRMSLSGDAMSHGILPGAAVGFLVAGLNVLPMTIGGFVAGLVVALASGLVARFTIQREDTSLAAFYLISLALGVMLVSLRGSSVARSQAMSAAALNACRRHVWACLDLNSFGEQGVYLDAPTDSAPAGTAGCRRELR